MLCSDSQKCIRYVFATKVNFDEIVFSQVTNTYILHLAMADECFLVGIPFLIVTMFMREWPFGTTMCKIYFTTTSINQITSSLFLMVLSADRYIAVCHPISSPRFRTGTISKVSPLRNL